MNYVYIGKLAKAFGLKGEMKIEVDTDFISERFKKGSFVYFLSEDQYLPFKVKNYRMHNDALLVSFEGYEDINLIEKYKGLKIYKSKDDIKPLKKGEYYFSDLENLDVYVNDKIVGKVLRVEEGPLYNLLRIVKNDNKQALVPYINVYVLDVDINKNRIDITDLEGLL